MENPRVVILFNNISKHHPTLDELDVLREVKFVREALEKLGYHVDEVPFSLKINKAMKKLAKIQPLLVFNLVESIENRGEFIHLAPSMLNWLKIPYTGGHLEATFITSNKVLTKKMLKSLGLQTPPWFKINELTHLSPHQKYIVKPIWEEGSLGIEEQSVFQGDQFTLIDALQKLDQEAFFVEQFIEGREFNVSLLSGNVLPIAEIKFIDYPPDKPCIVGYQAKWREESFEHSHTHRSFERDEQDKTLFEELTQLSLRCWHEFDLRGYARIDFRVDSQNVPSILEINVNPCISPDSGFVAATQQAGLKFVEVVEEIIKGI